jgi:hypothetical protein
MSENMRASLSAAHQASAESSPRAPSPAVTEHWRVGRKVGRTIYRQVGLEPSDDDVLIGVMDTPELAAKAVAALQHDPAQKRIEELENALRKIKSICATRIGKAPAQCFDIAEDVLAHVLNAADALQHDPAQKRIEELEAVLGSAAGYISADDNEQARRICDEIRAALAPRSPLPTEGEHLPLCAARRAGSIGPCDCGATLPTEGERGQ